ncbi:MAG TPA: DUF3280 domain-containing protein [Tardiphaga sp.]|jgi:hypothetical protein
MRPYRAAAFLLFVLAVPAHGQATAANLPSVAVFDLELLDTSLQGETDGPRSDERDRLLRVSDQIRKGLAESGRYAIVDIAPVNAVAHKKNLQACGGCDVQLAQQLGADLAVTGVVQKVSNLILNMNIYMRSVRTGHIVASMSADLRGNTDESWTRAASWLLRNRLLAPDFGKPQ